MDSGGRRGGSLKVLKFLQDHPAELAYDFRHRFNLSIDDIGGAVSLREAALLISVLLQTTDSWFQAAFSEWKHPVSREWIVLSHVYDLLAAVNSNKKAKPYPTPWPTDHAKKIGGKTKQSRSDVLSRLEQMNPKEDNGN